MELKDLLTESERKTRKCWLALLLAGLSMNAVLFFWLLGSAKMPTPVEISFGMRFFGFGMGMLFSCLYYILCYRRRTTFLLTFAVVSFWLSIPVNIWSFYKGTLQFDLFFGCGLLLSIASYIYARRLRHLNKAFKGYAKFPEESKEAAAFLHSASSKEELHNFFLDGLKKWPRLKWVLHRERNIKTDLLKDC